MQNSDSRINYRGHNNYDTAAASNEATIPEPYGESLTVQDHAADADINILMKRYGITGKMPDNPDELAQAMWGDFTNNPITDFRSAIEAVQRANEGFMLFPAEIRARFDNDPHKFITWVNDPANAEEGRKFGLVKPLPAPPTIGHETQAVIDAIKAGQQSATGAQN